MTADCSRLPANPAEIADAPAARLGEAEIERHITGKHRGLVFALSAPSGSGKDSVIARLKMDGVPLRYIVHTTTRAPRPGEVDGVDYSFLTREEFIARRDQGGFLEWAEYLGQLYGTPREPVEQALARGEDALLRPDVQGAMQIRELHPDAVLIFLVPPSIAELVARLDKRGTETEQAHRRVERAQVEIAHIPFYDYLVINYHGRLDETVEQVKAIITAERLRISVKSRERSAMSGQ